MIGLPPVPIVCTEIWSICRIAGAAAGAGAAAKAASGEERSRAAAITAPLRVEKVMASGFL
jgi:hypothetical protein